MLFLSLLSTSKKEKKKKHKSKGPRKKRAIENGLVRTEDYNIQIGNNSSKDIIRGEGERGERDEDETPAPHGRPSTTKSGQHLGQRIDLTLLNLLVRTVRVVLVGTRSNEPVQVGSARRGVSAHILGRLGGEWKGGTFVDSIQLDVHSGLVRLADWLAGGWRSQSVVDRVDVLSAREFVD